MERGLRLLRLGARGLGGGAQWTRPIPRGPQESVILWGSHSAVFWGPSEASRRVEAGKASVGVWGSNTKTGNLWV